MQDKLNRIDAVSDREVERNRVPVAVALGLLHKYDRGQIQDLVYGRRPADGLVVGTVRRDDRGLLGGGELGGVQAAIETPGGQ